METLSIKQNPLDSHECYIKINTDVKVSKEIDCCGEECYGISVFGKTVLLKESTALKVIEGLNMLMKSKELDKVKGKARIIKFNRRCRPKQWNM